MGMIATRTRGTTDASAIATGTVVEIEIGIENGEIEAGRKTAKRKMLMGMRR
jgi:hypothetical protein